MLKIENKLQGYSEFDQSLPDVINNAKEGRFWHWKRTYILKLEETEERIYSVQLNIFERLYAYFTARSVEEFLFQALTDKKISHVLNLQEIQLLIYNTFQWVVKEKREPIVGEIYKRIEDESLVWRGNQTIHLQSPHPLLSGIQPRREYWGRMAQCMYSPGLNHLLSAIDKIDQPDRTGLIAVDLGCGHSASTTYLLERGWKVICVDYSQEVLTFVEKRIAEVNQTWLDTNQVSFVCSDAENYSWPHKVDLVLAASSLPYCDPKKNQALMANITQSLNPEGYFVGNFFASEYVKPEAEDVTREMGAWLLKNEDDVGYLLADQGYRIEKCEHGGYRNPHSIVFVGQKVVNLENVI